MQVKIITDIHINSQNQEKYILFLTLQKCKLQNSH